MVMKNEYYDYVPEGWTIKTSKMCKDWWDKFFKEKEQPSVIVVKNNTDYLIPQIWAKEMLRILEVQTSLAELICPKVRKKTLAERLRDRPFKKYEEEMPTRQCSQCFFQFYINMSECPNCRCKVTNDQVTIGGLHDK